MHVVDADRAFFAEHGYVIVRGALDSSRVVELESALDSIRAGLPEPEPGAIWEAAGLSRAHPVLAEHARDARIGALVAELLDSDGVQLLQDTALVKPARVGGSVAWHRDHTYTGYLTPARLVSVRLALGPCTRASGCLEVIDGSHLHGATGELRAFTEGGVVELAEDRAHEWHDRVVALELAPGDLSLHHCLTLHRSGCNTSPHTRKTLVTRLFDASSTLLADQLPEAARGQFPTRDGAHLDPAVFPLVFSRRATQARSDSPR